MLCAIGLGIGYTPLDELEQLSLLAEDRMLESSIDLFDHEQTQNMGATLARWRRDSPVVRLPDGRVYLTTMADCWTVLRDPRAFANGNGFKAVEMPDEERMLGEMDPPRHPAMRRVMRQSFEKNSIEAERPFAAREARRMLDTWRAGDKAELISQFTDRISNLLSFQLVGFPLEDTDRIVAWTRELLHSDWPAHNRTARGQGLAGAFPEFAAYLDGLVETHRHSEGTNSFIARLARSQVAGRSLSATELRSMTGHIVLGGISTTTNLLGNLLYRLLCDPELHACLRADPRLIPAAVEESLRLDPPVLFVMRICKRAVEMGGVAIEAGEQVLVGIASANRDEALFDDPDDYRLDRGLPRHISFSGGAHHCIGAGLARLVAQEAIRAFVERFGVGDVALVPGFEFEGVPVFLEYGPARLDVEVFS